MTAPYRSRGMKKRSYKGKLVDEKKAEVQGLLSQLEEGVEGIRNSEGWAQWLKFQAALHHYSWNNCLLIAYQMPGASIVMGYNAWRDNGRQVKKGEKGLRILAPCFRKVENKETGEDEKKLVYFRAVSVFDVSQTEGEEVPEPCTKLEGGDSALFNALKEVSEKNGVPVRLESVSGSANGYYDCVGKFIAVEKSNSVAQQTKTLAHEIGHSLLHGDLSRDEQSRQDRELEAESVAFVVCAHFGLDTSDYSFGYIAHWKGEGAKDGIKKSAKRIADAAKKVIDAVEAISEQVEQKAA